MQFCSQETTFCNLKISYWNQDEIMEKSNQILKIIANTLIFHINHSATTPQTTQQ
jgi:hypothetical protein